MDENAPFTSGTVMGDDSSEESDRGKSVVTDALMAEMFHNPKQEDRQVEDASSPRTSDPSASPWRSGNFAWIRAEEVARRGDEWERELLKELGLPVEKRPKHRRENKEPEMGVFWLKTVGLGTGNSLSS